MANNFIYFTKKLKNKKQKTNNNNKRLNRYPC